SQPPHWQDGWIVALDRDREGQPDADALARHVPGPQVRVVGSAGRDLVRFRPSGAAPGTNLSLVVWPHTDETGHARVVVISNAGRIREAQADAAQPARCTN